MFLHHVVEFADYDVSKIKNQFKTKLVENSLMGKNIVLVQVSRRTL